MRSAKEPSDKGQDATVRAGGNPGGEYEQLAEEVLGHRMMVLGQLSDLRVADPRFVLREVRTCTDSYAPPSVSGRPTSMVGPSTVITCQSSQA